MLFFLRFAFGSLKIVTRGGAAYWAWVGLLLALMAVGGATYLRQLHTGLITTNMSDHVSWAFYIGNFTFLVGVAAAAVVLVIPAYIYHWKPIKEIVVIGELLAVSAIVMCIGFVVGLEANTGATLAIVTVDVSTSVADPSKTDRATV